MNCFVFKNQVGRRAHFDTGKCFEPQRTPETGDQKPLGFSLAKAENPSAPCSIREKVKYAGHKVTFLIVSVIIRLHLGAKLNHALMCYLFLFGLEAWTQKSTLPDLKHFLMGILYLFDEYHLMTTGRQLTVSSRWTPSVVN